MIIYFSLWTQEINLRNLQLLRDNISDVESIVLFGEQEYFYGIISKNSDKQENINYFDEVQELSHTHNIPFYIITCSADALLDNDSKYTNMRHIYWKNYWFSATMHGVIHHMGIVDNITIPNQFKYPFLCMNGRPHAHRRDLMLTFMDRGLDTIGAISWRAGDMYIHKNSAGIPNRRLYELLVIDRYTHKFNQFAWPLEFFESFVQIVPETSVNHMIISEKTVMPLLYKKPFIALAKVGHHAFLQQYGFKLYDELFDYSFDLIEDLQERINAIVNMTENICHMSYDEMTKMKELLAPKLEYNAAIARKIGTNINNIPAQALYSYWNRSQKTREGSPQVVEFMLAANEQAIRPRTGQ